MNDRYVKELVETLENVEIDIKNDTVLDYEAGMEKIVDCFLEHKGKRSQVYFIGNGGSSAIASHMTADFMKNGGMKTYSLYDNAVTTCMGNDYGYEYVFSKPLEFLGQADDLLVAVSSSGNSSNIVNAIRTADARHMHIITLTGFKKDNVIKQLGDINVYVPCEKYGIVESIHNLILQQAVDMIMERDGGLL